MWPSDLDAEEGASRLSGERSTSLTVDPLAAMVEQQPDLPQPLPPVNEVFLAPGKGPECRMDSKLVV